MSLILSIIIASLGAMVAMARYGPSDGAKLLAQKVRSVIIGFLHRQPGSSITNICNSTQIAWGTAQHHLYLLSKAGLVNSLPMGRSRAFFVAGTDQLRQTQLALLRQEPSTRIGRVVLEHPEVMQKDLLVKIGMTRKVFRHHMNLLVAAGLVVEHRSPRARTYRPTPELVTLHNAGALVSGDADFVARSGAGRDEGSLAVPSGTAESAQVARAPGYAARRI